MYTSIYTSIGKWKKLLPNSCTVVTRSSLFVNVCQHSLENWKV